MKYALHAATITTLLLCVALLLTMSGCISYTPATPPRPKPGHEQACQIALLQQLQKSGAQVIRIGEEIRLLIPKPHLFEVGLSAPTSEGRALLEKVARLIQSYKDVEIGIIAHADDIGSYREKMKNTTQQARNIAAYLWFQGISPHQMHMIGWGDRYPIVDDPSPSGRAINRRIEIRIR